MEGAAARMQRIAVVPHRLEGARFRHDGERLAGTFNASPIATADGRIYYASAGPSWVIQAGPKFELLGKSDLGEPGSASAAVADGRLFLEGSQTLYCVGRK